MKKTSSEHLKILGEKGQEWEVTWKSKFKNDTMEWKQTQGEKKRLKKKERAMIIIQKDVGLGESTERAEEGIKLLKKTCLRNQNKKYRVEDNEEGLEV